jgi:hypothetical protein
MFCNVLFSSKVSLLLELATVVSVRAPDFFSVVAGGSGTPELMEEDHQCCYIRCCRPNIQPSIVHGKSNPATMTTLYCKVVTQEYGAQGQGFLHAFVKAVSRCLHAFFVWGI